MWEDASNKNNTIWYLIMNNINLTYEVGVRFDLKGSEAGWEHIFDAEDKEENELKK